ncbi:MAG: CBS domain-containing protein [Methyloligellaceae bacterium]
MPPESYRGPLKKDEKKESSRSFSQSTGTGLAAEGAGNTVGAILADKGDDIYTITPDMTIREVVGELHQRKIGVLLILDDDQNLQGIVSERDVVYGISEKGETILDEPVRNIMTPDPVTCSPGDHLQVIMTKMTEGRFRHMPVIDHGIACGMVSIRDVVHHRLKELEYENLKIKQLIVG